MSVSRRIFLRAASAVGVTAAIPGCLTSLAFGQSESGNNGFALPRQVANDPLTAISQEMFTQTLNSEYRFRVGGETIRLSLKQVVNADSAAVRANGKTGECFTLVFQGDAETPVQQGTYTVKHAAFGKLRLLIVPGAVNRGTQNYEAVINRLPQ